ncbi:MAG: glycosyltransferase [Candidatus Kapaibacterium sp.]|jgi:glycosyltransferase involved in cell wall biosynthesis
MKISVCLIVKNEESCLKECLQSVIAFADEIIIVDTGSNDATVAIAQEFTTQVFTYIWDDDFAAARNYALHHATGDWIVSIDADEIIMNPEKMRDSLLALPANIGGALIELESHAHRADGSRDTFLIHLLRVFRNSPQIRWEYCIHEQILESIIRAGLSIQYIPVRYFHKGYDLSPEKMKQKHERNVNLLTKHLEKNPNDGYMWFQRAKTYRALAHNRQAFADITKALKYLNNNHSAKPQALNEAALLAYQDKDFITSVQFANESLNIIPQQKFALYICAESLYEIGQYDVAISCYVAIKDMKEQSTAAMILGDYNVPIEQVDFRIGKCYAAKNEWDKAEHSFRAGLSVNSHDVGCLVGMANWLLKKNAFHDAYDYAGRASSLAPENQEIQKIYSFLATQIAAAPQQQILRDKKPFLSLSMIVKNEEKYLQGCLESVVGLADEIIIVDTGSTDSTVAIAQQYGAKVFTHPWEGDFAQARNYALSYTKGEWVLYLDADERIHPEAKIHLRQLLHSLPDDIGALLCTIHSPHRQGDEVSEMHSGSYPRIFRNYGYPTIAFQGRVHEQISPSIIALGKSIVQSDVIIDHLGYDLSREEMEKKLQRNYQLLLQHVKEQPENAYAWFQLGQTLARMNIIKEAEEALQLSLQLQGLAPHIRASAAAVLAQLCGNTKRFSDALRWAGLSLEAVPEQVYALHLQAYALYYLGRYAESEKVFTQVLEKRHLIGSQQSQAGFEVHIDENLIRQGLEAAKKAQGK